jgi:rare lipoprotein A
VKKNVKVYFVLAAMIMFAMYSPAAEASSRRPSTYERAGDKIIWKIDGITVWKFPTAHASDVSLLSGRFNLAYGDGFKLADLRVENSKGKWSLLVGKDILFSVPPEYAASVKQDPKALALSIMSKLYEAIGQGNSGTLTAAHKIRGKYETSAPVSWYGGKFIGRRFANGERYKDTDLTAAAKSLPFGTLVKVTAPSGKSVVVRITDRFNEYRNRVLDLSHAAADLIGIKSAGVPKAKIEVIGKVETIGGE